jgi:hypothetical protein
VAVVQQAIDNGRGDDAVAAEQRACPPSEDG